MFNDLPPVGNPIRLFESGQSKSLVEQVFSPYTPRYFTSGTAALAAAICAASRLKNIDNPEVILPAYACPDLVSAAVYAKTTPKLVDLEANRPWMDLEQLSQCITPQTVAIIAVHLFGIAEQMERLREIATHFDVLLIEDSAQYFPGKQEAHGWCGDLVVLSFGRGKPVSLLGGGAVLVQDGALDQRIPNTVGFSPQGMRKRMSFWLKAMLYNQMIKPWLYWIPQQLPFLHLGETRYHLLNNTDAMDAVRFALLSTNMNVYRDDTLARQKTMVTMLAGLERTSKEMIDLPAICQVSAQRRLLRYPLLVTDEPLRDRLFEAMNNQGLGVSKMYPLSLPAIPGLESMFAGQGPFPAADAFARAILTLPLHRQVRGLDIERMGHIFEKNGMNTVL